MKFSVYKHQAQRAMAVIMHLPLAAYPFVLPPEIRCRLPCQTMATLQQAEPFTGPPLVIPSGKTAKPQGKGQALKNISALTSLPT